MDDLDKIGSSGVEDVHLIREGRGGERTFINSVGFVINRIENRAVAKRKMCEARTFKEGGCLCRLMGMTPRGGQVW